MAVARDTPTIVLGTAKRELVQQRRTRPVLWFAGVGAAFLGLAIYVVGAWLASGPKSVPVGPTKMPGWMSTSLIVQQVLYTGVAVVAFWFFVAKPLIRNKRLSTDGMLYISFGLLYWQDPISHYFTAWYTYNAGLVNLGSWVVKVPGFSIPYGVPPEPLLAVLPLYAGWMFPAVIVTNWVMRKAKETWPRLGRLGMCGAAFVFVAMVDVFFESIWMRTGFYSYPGVIGKLTLWHGHYYQLPGYEPVIFGVLVVTWAALRYFKNDKGQMLAERGIDELRVKPKQRAWIQFLALFGVVNAVYFAAMIVYVYIAMFQSPWPEDIVKRSYLSNGLCGPGTSYACPGGNIPIPRKGGAYMGSDGRVVLPAGSAPKQAYEPGHSWNPYQME